MVATRVYWVSVGLTVADASTSREYFHLSHSNKASGLYSLTSLSKATRYGYPSSGTLTVPSIANSAFVSMGSATKNSAWALPPWPSSLPVSASMNTTATSSWYASKSVTSCFGKS